MDGNELQISITSPHGELYHQSLPLAILVAKASRTDEILRFTYDVVDPDSGETTYSGAARIMVQDLPDPRAEVQPEPPAGATAPHSMPTEAELADRMFGAGTAEQLAHRKAREVWPEADGFLPHTRGWTFEVEHGYAYVTTAGVVAREPQGTRFDAVSSMGRRTPPARVDGPGCTPATITVTEVPDRAYLDQDGE
ncbi:MULTISPECIES: hypothetical protein [Streptomyces]|uniref:hypothetical protein n=1 Tax=Streptomyces TaxID=1883 RepID=UPI00131E2DEB|nr:MULTISPECIES: hypothetical protein [Streptomyces]